ncbi:MAG TPA: hypothetical protein VL418_11065 [Devosiaceae bacterium]|nr:hypothetical protein [Devosiaceae bacterium]
MTDDWLLPSGHSAAFLPEDSALMRLPRGPGRPRQKDFVVDKFETRALVYDAFWHADGRRILLVGPPPINLGRKIRKARYLALPSGAPLSRRYHVSASVMLTELVGAPPETTHVEMLLADERFELAVQPNSSAALAGARVLFTMSKDNDLAWIREWAHYHAVVQRADTVLLFDNGSSRYAPAEIEATLHSVAGIRHAAVMSLPYRYGATDFAVLANPYYGLFLQIASMSIALRRYGARAYGLLNCDVDELAASPPDTTVFDLAHNSPHGLVVMRGQFMEAVLASPPNGKVPTHRDYLTRRRDPLTRLSRPRKWALDPTRAWISGLGVHPYMHWIQGRPWFRKTQPEGMFHWHFRGINTNWKENRTDASHLAPADLELDEHFAAIIASPAFRSEE